MRYHTIFNIMYCQFLIGWHLDPMAKTQSLTSENDLPISALVFTKK